MKYKNKIIILLAIFFIPIISETNALYLDKLNKSTELYIAKPICRVILDKEIFISNYIQKPFYFSICNFDDDNNISDTVMNYSIMFHISQINAPLIYKLYKVDENKSKKSVLLEKEDNILRTKELTLMKVNEKYIDNYVLEIEYNNKSTNELDEDFEIVLEVYSEQYISDKEETR